LGSEYRESEREREKERREREREREKRERERKYRRIAKGIDDVGEYLIQ